MGGGEGGGGGGGGRKKINKKALKMTRSFLDFFFFLFNISRKNSMCKTNKVNQQSVLNL